MIHQHKFGTTKCSSSHYNLNVKVKPFFVWNLWCKNNNCWVFQKTAWQHMDRASWIAVTETQDEIIWPKSNYKDGNTYIFMTRLMTRLWNRIGFVCLYAHQRLRYAMKNSKRNSWSNYKVGRKKKYTTVKFRWNCILDVLNHFVTSDI